MAVPSLSVIRHGCLLRSLTRAGTPAPLQQHRIQSWERTHIRVDEFFTWFNFRRCSRAKKINRRNFFYTMENVFMKVFLFIMSIIAIDCVHVFVNPVDPQ